MPLDINDGLFVFLSKADKDDDLERGNEGVYRSPLDLRPLTLKNSENKVVAGVTNWIINPVVEKTACSSQNGFAAGRQLLQNAVDLDFKARQDSLLFQQAMDDGNLCFSSSFSDLSNLSIAHRDILNSLPITVLFDYAMAFPSVCHAWVFFMLDFLGMPIGLIDAVKAHIR